jgi:probable rRNA maturation factor
MKSIEYYVEELDFTLSDEDKITAWLDTVICQHYSKSHYHLTYILTNDEYVRAVNVEHLDHDYYTDIITFPMADIEGEVEADIFISIDRVRDNADTYGVSFESELRRVLVHGVLHLLGHSDETEADKKAMRKLEDDMLNLYNFV